VTTSLAKKRIPPGTPNGGQFARSTRGDAGPLDLGDSRTAVAFEQAQKSGSYFARRYGVDGDEITQDTIIAYLDTSRRRGEDSPIANVNGYVHSTARSIANAAMAGTGRSEVRAAMTEFRELTAAQSQQLGRLLTTAESDALANDIRNRQKLRRRAPEGFQRPVHFVDIDNHPEAQSVVAQSAESAEFQAGSISEMAERLCDSGKKKEARRIAWDALAEISDVPMVTPGSLTELESAKARRLVTEASGAGAAAQEWNQGLSHPSTRDALFAPFGDLDDNGRDAVAHMLTQHRHFADSLWDAAVTAATAKRKGAA
jgi:hypothetical protein